MIDLICFPEDAWNENLISEELIKGKQSYFALFLNDEMIAYLNGFTVDSEAELNRIAVLTEHRNKGIGRYLLNEYVKFLKENGCTRLMLEVRETNHPAISLYASAGFKKDGIRKNYYTNPAENAVLLSLEI